MLIGLCLVRGRPGAAGGVSAVAEAARPATNEALDRLSVVRIGPARYGSL